MRIFFIILLLLFTNSLLAKENKKILCTLDKVIEDASIGGKEYKSNDTFLFEINITDEEMKRGGGKVNLVEGSVDGPLMCGNGKFIMDSYASDKKYALWCGSQVGNKYYWYHFQIWRYTEYFHMFHHIDDNNQTEAGGSCKKAEQKL